MADDFICSGSLFYVTVAETLAQAQDRCRTVAAGLDASDVAVDDSGLVCTWTDEYDDLLTEYGLDVRYWVRVSHDEASEHAAEASLPAEDGEFGRLLRAAERVARRKLDAMLDTVPGGWPMQPSTGPDAA